MFDNNTNNKKKQLPGQVLDTMLIPYNFYCPFHDVFLFLECDACLLQDPEMI